MSNHPNHRRDESDRTEHGPRWENHECDRNSAHARTKWKRRINRQERRTGSVVPDLLYSPRVRPPVDSD